LYATGKTEEQARDDAKKGVKNMTIWLDMVLKPEKNAGGNKFEKFIGAEQEFNTFTYGIKGNIDATILLKNAQGEDKMTALELKTGKNKKVQYRAQVIIYCLLISERFLNSNPDNILLYILDDDVENGFQIIAENKNELDQLIMGRNELAKWFKNNGGDQISLPPMISNYTECRFCFQKEVCSLAAISMEANKSKVNAERYEQFPTFKYVQDKTTPEVKEYFAKYYQCINLEQNAELGGQIAGQGVTERGFQYMGFVKTPNDEGTIVTLLKGGPCTLNEGRSVNLRTENNISFYRGFVKSKSVENNLVEIKIEFK